MKRHNGCCGKSFLEFQTDGSITKSKPTFVVLFLQVKWEHLYIFLRFPSTLRSTWPNCIDWSSGHYLKPLPNRTKNVPDCNVNLYLAQSFELKADANTVSDNALFTNCIVFRVNPGLYLQRICPEASWINDIRWSFDALSSCRDMPIMKPKMLTCCWHERESH